MKKRTVKNYFAKNCCSFGAAGFAVLSFIDTFYI